MSEARTAFLATLRAGLRAAPAPLVDEAVAEYAAHFEEGARAGRDEAEIARSLGDPLDLADELAVQFRIEKWEQRQSPANGWSVFTTAATRLAHRVTVRAVMMLSALSAAMLILLVLLFFASGFWLLFAGPALSLPGGPAVGWLAAAGLLFAGVATSSLAALLVHWLIDWIGARARGEFRIITPVKPKKVIA